MEKVPHEQYEYARKRLRQKKHLYFHVVLFLTGSLFAFVANHFLKFGLPHIWYPWVITIWLFIFIIHFIKVYILDRFMNKQWEREQIDRLISQQHHRMSQLESKLNQEHQ